MPKSGYKPRKPGITLKQLDDIATAFFYQELLKLRLVESIEDVKKYFLHSTGHSLRLDAYDM